VFFITKYKKINHQFNPNDQFALVEYNYQNIVNPKINLYLCLIFVYKKIKKYNETIVTVKILDVLSIDYMDSYLIIFC
jgi:hypothetical protein